MDGRLSQALVDAVVIAAKAAEQGAAGKGVRHALITPASESLSAA